MNRPSFGIVATLGAAHRSDTRGWPSFVSGPAARRGMESQV